jgi:hypothetical protein
MNLKYVLCIELSVNAAHFVDLLMQFVENGHKLHGWVVHVS